MAKKKIKIGIIGGSGLDDPKLLDNYKRHSVNTPYGRPSSEITAGNISGVEVAIIARHNFDHSIPPTKVPFQANIWALKEAGCSHILASSACGSLKEEIKPGDIVLPDQFIDNTKHRILTLYEDKVIHTSMADPFCIKLRKILSESCQKLNINYHANGTVITIEGPRFSTRAESKMFQQWGGTIVNMTTVPEIILAREAGICYQVIAVSTDYDCWKRSEEPVTWDTIVSRMEENAQKVKNLIINSLDRINFSDCSCRR